MEIAICDAATRLRRRGVNEFHGYEIAKRIGEDADSKLLTAYGTLYRALGRLESMGLLESRWEIRESPGRRESSGAPALFVDRHRGRDARRAA